MPASTWTVTSAGSGAKFFSSSRVAGSRALSRRLAGAETAASRTPPSVSCEHFSAPLPGSTGLCPAPSASTRSWTRSR